MYGEMKRVDNEMDGNHGRMEGTSAKGNEARRNYCTGKSGSVRRLTSAASIATCIGAFSKPGRVETFASDFATPGSITDDITTRSDQSADSMRGKGKKEKKSICKSRSNRVTSAEGQNIQMQERGSSSGTRSDEGMQMRGVNHQKLREAFQLFDRDNDGRITRAEITRAMQSLGYRPTEEEIADMLDKADFNRNGTIEFEEFLQVMTNECAESVVNGRHNVEQELKDMFEIFDLNKDGRISAQELNYVMRTLGENLSNSELEDMMRTADTNGDGTIDFQEFQNLFRLYDQNFSGWGESSFAVATH